MTTLHEIAEEERRRDAGFSPPVRVQQNRPHGYVRDRINGTPCEIEYRDSKGHVCGYWAYGSFDPRLPYQGE